MVSADLLKRGFPVFRALSPSCICDLIIIVKSKLLRVEVTSGNRKHNSDLLYPRKDFSRFDLLAIVEKDGRITYMPDLVELTEERLPAASALQCQPS